MSLTTELLEVTETLLSWTIGERQCVYDGYAVDEMGAPISLDDIQELAEYDEVINKAQAVIEKVKGDL